MVDFLPRSGILEYLFGGAILTEGIYWDVLFSDVLSRL